MVVMLLLLLLLLLLLVVLVVKGLVYGQAALVRCRLPLVRQDAAVGKGLNSQSFCQLQNFVLFKGTVSRDFLLLVFFHESGPRVSH
jgi:hypothetical protein